MGDGKSVTLHFADGTEINARINMLTMRYLTECSRDDAGNKIKGTRYSDYARLSKQYESNGKEMPDELKIDITGKFLFALLCSNGRKVATIEEALELVDVDGSIIDDISMLMDAFSARLDDEKKSSDFLQRKGQRQKPRRRKKK